MHHDKKTLHSTFMYSFSLQVYFTNDAVYLVAMAVFSISSGYIGSIVMMYGPKMMTSGEDQGRAASLLVFFLVFGLSVGSAFSKAIVALL